MRVTVLYLSMTDRGGVRVGRGAVGVHHQGAEHRLVAAAASVSKLLLLPLLLLWLLHVVGLLLFMVVLSRLLLMLRLVSTLWSTFVVALEVVILLR